MHFQSVKLKWALSILELTHSIWGVSHKRCFVNRYQVLPIPKSPVTLSPAVWVRIAYFQEAKFTMVQLCVTALNCQECLGIDSAPEVNIWIMYWIGVSELFHDGWGCTLQVLYFPIATFEYVVLDLFPLIRNNPWFVCRAIILACNNNNMVSSSGWQVHTYTKWPN